MSRGAADLDRKQNELAALLSSFGSVCVGYSGGVDSTFLARFALDVLGPDSMLAVTGLSPSYPAVQRQTALECAQRFGIPHLEIETDEIGVPEYAANPANRCFFCKSELWTKIAAVARERGLAVVADGSNADDAGDYRPGAGAAAQHDVRSPLQEVGLSKAEIRILSQRLGLPTWDHPSAPCLASRLPYGLEVTTTRLRQVEAAEEKLRTLGFDTFRVRHHGDEARIEVAPRELGKAVELASDLARGLRGIGFRRVLLDVEGYRQGALNEALPAVVSKRDP